jgi:hypothetical protein
MAEGTTEQKRGVVRQTWTNVLTDNFSSCLQVK